MRRKVAPDQEIAAIAARQGGVLSHAQLIALGVGASAIDRRVRAGRLHRVFRGVYAVGHNAQLARYAGPADTRSELERLVNHLCDGHDLPRPLLNCSIEGRVRDPYGRIVGSSSRRTRTGTGPRPP